MNANHTTADILGLQVEYRGINGVGQHCFSNGSPLVTHVFHSLQDGVERFGSRINLQERYYRLSQNFKAGYTSATYAPISKDRGALVEYGLGHIKRLIEQQAQREAKRVPPPAPVRVTAPTPAISPKPNPVAEMVARALAPKPPTAAVDELDEPAPELPAEPMPEPTPPKRGPGRPRKQP